MTPRPACGQLIAPEIMFNGPVLQRIYNELKRGPKNIDSLRDMIWGHRGINPHAIYVEVKLLREKLLPYGLTVRCYRSKWGSGTYCLEGLQMSLFDRSSAC